MNNPKGLGSPYMRKVTLQETYGEDYPMILRVEAPKFPGGEPRVLLRDHIRNGHWPTITQAKVQIAFGPTHDAEKELDEMTGPDSWRARPNSYKKNRVIEGVHITGSFLTRRVAGYPLEDNVWELSVDHMSKERIR